MILTILILNWIVPKGVIDYMVELLQVMALQPAWDNRLPEQMMSWLIERNKTTNCWPSDLSRTKHGTVQYHGQCCSIALSHRYHRWPVGLLPMWIQRICKNTDDVRCCSRFRNVLINKMKIMIIITNNSLLFCYSHSTFNTCQQDRNNKHISDVDIIMTCKSTISIQSQIDMRQTRFRLKLQYQNLL